MLLWFVFSFNCSLRVGCWLFVVVCVCLLKSGYRLLSVIGDVCCALIDECYCPFFCCSLIAACCSLVVVCCMWLLLFFLFGVCILVLYVV